MNSLVGVWLICKLTITLTIPNTTRTVQQTGDFKCLVVDDLYESQNVLVVDCRKELMWLNPKFTDGFFILRKSFGECTI